MNSMILNEIYFAGLGASDQPESVSDALKRDFGSVDRRLPNFRRWARRRAAARGGCY